MWTMAAFVMAAGMGAQDDYAGLRSRVWDGAPRGTLRADGASQTGTEIDLTTDLDVDDRQPLYNGVAWVGLPGLGRLYLDFGWGLTEADEVLARDVVYGGITFPAGQEVHTEIEWRSLTTLFEYHVSLPVGEGAGKLRLGLRSGTFYARIQSELGSSAEESSAAVNAVVPIFGGSAELYLGQAFSIEAEGRVTHIESFGSLSVTLYDLSVAVRGGYGGIYGAIGYRWFAIDVEDDRGEVDEIALDVKSKGFFVELGFRF